MSVRLTIFFYIIVVFYILHYSANVVPKNGSCTPGELVWVECNLCTCNPQGMPNQVCAKMWCQPTPALKDANKTKESAKEEAKELENDTKLQNLEEIEKEKVEVDLKE